MAEPEDFRSPANLFLQQEVYRLGSSAGLRSLPQGPERDFLTLTWGPVVYRTTYAPECKRLLRVFLRCLNDAISHSIARELPGSDKQLQVLKNTYSSKVFSAEMYNGLDEDGVRNAFHDFKVSLAIPAIELPSRLRVCLMVDDMVLSHLKGELDRSSRAAKDADIDRCWVKLVEENFPDSRLGDQPYICEVDVDGETDGAGDYRGVYRGWTMVALTALIEVFKSLGQMRHLQEYHREGRIYLGQGKWSL
ncbi:hypothetical protein N7474_004777 [Penicillium riverlandense]|uniref:uncharacterized protein n=1 Tax=Penicillium riverlandense TaxID=1903569 RepID=UPI0025469096|nr:uncharacterized protein N7474_004777 [Penicillium riverlandense]KAJ5819186.1 hypothetical protein N7474_004777 [Penicillium riverlandense]